MTRLYDEITKTFYSEHYDDEVANIVFNLVVRTKERLDRQNIEYDEEDLYMYANDVIKNWF